MSLICLFCLVLFPHIALSVWSHQRFPRGTRLATLLAGQTAAQPSMACSLPGASSQTACPHNKFPLAGRRFSGFFLFFIEMLIRNRLQEKGQFFCLNLKEIRKKMPLAFSISSRGESQVVL